MFLKQLTYKLEMLLPLSTASRVSSVRSLNIHCMGETEEKYNFYFDKLHKKKRKGQSLKPIIYHAFKDNQELLVVNILMNIFEEHQP